MTLYIGDKPVGLCKIVEKKVPKTKFGASVDAWIGDVDENGVLNPATNDTIMLDFSEVKEIAELALQERFRANRNIVGADFGSVEIIRSSGLQYTFYECSNFKYLNLSSVKEIAYGGLSNSFQYTKISGDADGCLDLSKLTTVAGNGIYYTFWKCEFKVVDLRSLTTVDSRGMAYCFYQCGKLEQIILNSLTSMGSGCMQRAFYSSGLLSIYFPSLISVKSDTFGSSSSNNAFGYCSNLTEIHFRADMQTTIEGLSQYANKWGATNATIYFDLIGTITVNGVTYTRKETNSIWDGRIRTYVAWADGSDNIVYTDATAEPAVGTAVYSDAGTTQVGTVEGVA